MVRIFVRIGQFFFKYRDLISPCTLIAIVLLSGPRKVNSDGPTDIALDIFGIFLVLCGQFLRVCVIGFAYIKRGGRNRQVYAESLVKEGFFAHCRNPMYLGNFLLVLGYSVILNSAFGYLIGIPFFVFLYWTIVLAEEHFLSNKFGDDYADYQESVNRFIPDLRGIRTTLSGMKYDWKRVIRKEYGTIFATMTAVLSLITWDHFDALKIHEMPKLLIGLISIWCVSFVAYLAARYAKKKRLLGSDTQH